MLSFFPEILFLAPLAATFIRLALAILFAHAAWVHAQRGDMASRVLAFAEIAVALALAIGAWTQLAALLGALVMVAALFRPTIRSVPTSATLLALVMALTLVVTGAGPLAFDLPL